MLDLARSSVAMAVLGVSVMAMFALAIAFLVAASALRYGNDRKAARWTSLEQSWGASIGHIAQGLVGAETLHYGIKSEERLLLLDYLFKSSVKETARDRKELYARLAGPYLFALEPRVRKGDVFQRARAIRTLAELGGTSCASVIIEALDDEASHVAMTAARAYAALKLGPIEPLLERIERYRVWDRRLLRLTLASLGLSAAPALHRCFADSEQSPATRAVCADALASMRYRGANATAIAALQSSSDVDLRAAALRLIRPPIAENAHAVVRDLCASNDPIERAQAVACLARIGDEADVATLERALADLSPWVVLNANKALGGKQPASPNPPSLQPTEAV